MRPTKMHVLPRSSGPYSQLDNGSSGPKGPRRFGWKTVAVVLGLFFGTVWLVGPQGSYDKFMNPEGSTSSFEDVDFPDGLPNDRPNPPYNPVKGNKGSSKVDDNPTGLKTLPTSPHSPETDPDPRKTVHCLAPHDPAKPLVQYALMLDAGSTGSRIHIYKFHNCLSSGPTLEYEVFQMTKPGLSSYAGRPLAAAESLDGLMAEAVKVVPTELQGCTNVAVKATAGLRLLGSDASQEILSAVQNRLRNNYKFQLAGQDAVAIMDGKDEGVFAWITANYLLGTIGGTGNIHSQPTYAVLDLGGASTQIVFEPTFSPSKSSETSGLEDGDHKYILSFSGRTHTLYQHSYLGYGLMRARRSVNNLVGFMWDFRSDGHGHTGPGAIGDEYNTPPLVANPCLAKGTKRVVKLDGGKWRDQGDGFNVTMSGEDVGSFDSCNRIVELVMAKDALCNVKPCSFNGAYQPSILDSFSTGGILALSYFYDRINPLLEATTGLSSRAAVDRVGPKKGGKKLAGIPDAVYSSSSTSDSSKDPNSIPISHIALLAQRVCEGRKSWERHFSSSSELMEELEGRPEYCLDLTFMHALLRLGYEFGGERSVRLEKKLDGVELGWCLGATIAMVMDGDLKCVA